jgi:predicted DNA-binding transcriptional regulator AlpA
VAAIVERVRAAMARRILDDLAGEDTVPPGVRIAVRGWVGFTEAAVLDWLEHRDLTHDELRELLIQALRSVVEAAYPKSVAR